MKPTVSLHGVTRNFGDRKVLAIDELKFEPGSPHALVGHNGAGKTTLLRLIAGLDSPCSGTISLDCRRDEIGFCFQRPFMFRGSVAFNIGWGLRRNRSMSHAERMGEVAALARRLCIGHLLGQHARSLSAGEMQKTSLARTLICAPRLILFDEPSANLDDEGVTVVEREIRNMTAAGGTCIIATHIFEHAIRFSARVIRLEKGKVLGHTTADDLNRSELDGN